MLNYRHKCNAHCIEVEKWTLESLEHHRCLMEHRRCHCLEQTDDCRCQVENDNSSLEIGILPVSFACADGLIQS